jgi:hypothetical protein
MKKVIVTVALLLIGVMAFAQERIAVFPFEDLNNVFTQNESIFFYRQFSNEFTNRSAGRFITVPRVDVERLFNIEAAFQLNDLSSRAKTAEMQQVLNGTQILSGMIGRVGSSIAISISLYTFPDFRQLPGGVDLRVANTGELFDKIPELVASMQTAIAGSGILPPPPGTSGPANRTYNIGDTGPAGGIIFYDRGFVADGWRYLEAAPAGTDFTAEWGAYTGSGNSYSGRDVPGTNTAVGSGKRNTELIVARLQQWGENYRAAQVCVGMDINGYKDWFLPSKDELNLMYQNLHRRGLGGFGGTFYWSSSQDGSSFAWYQGFSGGYQSSYLKSITASVRAVRAF